MAINEIIINGTTVINLREDTVVEEELMGGYTAHDKSGEVIDGTAGAYVVDSILVVPSNASVSNNIATIE